MKLIPLTKGYFAQVDDSDFDLLNQCRWHAVVGKYTVYASRGCKDENGKWVALLMHRVIMDVTDPKTDVDHKDLDGLNNTRENIRTCTRSQNQMNSGSRNGSVSRFRGVSWNKINKKWTAYISISGKTKHLGLFKNEEDAARSYNQLAKDHHGEFARFNEVSPMFPEKEWEPLVIIETNTSGFRGVHFEKDRGKWQSYIVKGCKKIQLGRFETAIEAAKAYDRAAIDMRGDAARLNFPNQI